MSKITIVDQNDTIIGSKERSTLDSNDIYRVSGLWIENTKGEILIAQRSFTKKNHPGCRGPAVAGTVEEGETYEENIIKEAQEELGVNLHNHEYVLVKHYLSQGRYKHFSALYKAVIDQDLSTFVIQKEEVECIKWISKDELQADFIQHPDKYVESMPNLLDTFK